MEEHDRILKLLGFEVFRADDKFYYKTPKPGRRSLHKVSEVKSFLEREKAEGRLLNVTKEMFHFRRKRKQSESLGAGGDAGDAGNTGGAQGLPQGSVAAYNEDFPRSPVAAYNEDYVEEENAEERSTDEKVETLVDAMVKLLIKKSGSKVNHRQLLSSTARELDDWMSALPLPNCSADEFLALKTRIMDAECLDQLVGVIINHKACAKSAAWELGQGIVGEVAMLATNGPLSEFPPDVNHNLYARVCQMGMEKLPLLTAILARVTIRSSTSVMPSDVVLLANAVANICYLANKNLDSVMKTRTFALQASGITDDGLDLMKASGLSMTARHLNVFRDKFAEVGPKLLESLSLERPVQVLLDNLNFRVTSASPQENLMIKCSVVEATDTRMLSTLRKGKAEILEGINLDQVLLGSPANAQEKDHLIATIARGWGFELAKSRPRAEKLGALLKPPKGKVPQHIVNVDKVYACCETSHSDMVRLFYTIQAEHLKLVAGVSINSKNGVFYKDHI